MDEPLLSVVLVAPDGWTPLRRTVAALARQEIASRLELVLVVPESHPIALDAPEVAGDVVGIGAVRSVVVAQISASGAPRAAGARAARAPVVAFAEDHCFPDAGWGEALLAAHRGPWAAVGPAIRNANPRTLLSWADLFIGYGPWLAPGAAREMDHLPGHNSSYKRAVLESYGESLEGMLETETLLHWDLRRRGHRLYFEPAATAAHMNFAVLRSWIAIHFLYGRLFASTRAREWGWLRRTAFALGAPLIPAVRLARTVSAVHGSGAGAAVLARALPWIVLALVLDGCGQLAGYAVGPGHVRQRAAELEAHRDRHVPPADLVPWQTTASASAA